MTFISRLALALALGGLVLSLAPAPAAAQPGPYDRWTFDLRMGASSPKSDLGDMADDGQMVGMGLGYRILRRVTLRAEGSLENLERGGDPALLGGIRGPDIELWRYMAVLHLEMTDPAVSRWEVTVDGGAGGTWIDASEAPPRIGAFSGHEPTVTAGLTAGYDVGRHFTLFARFDGYLTLGEPGEAPELLGKEPTLTHTVGLRLSW